MNILKLLLRMKYVAVQPFKCLLHPAEWQGQIHADMTWAVERSAILPDNSDFHSGSLQFIDRLPMLLTPLCAVQKQHVGSFRL